MRTVYKNGTVYTGNGFVTDFAVENGKFCFVGETDKATADEVVDLGGKFVCAGFNDSHACAEPRQCTDNGEPRRAHDVFKGDARLSAHLYKGNGRDTRHVGAGARL